MSDANEMRQRIAATLRAGETVNEPLKVSLDPADQPEWTPPALNDNRRLKADIMAALQGTDNPETGK